MPTNLTSKGQVTVPKNIRDYLGLKPGAAVTFERLASGEIAIKPFSKRQALRKGFFAKMRGSATVKMSTDEIMALMRGSGPDDPG